MHSAQHGTTALLVLQFLEEVWNRGDIEASRKYVGGRYTLHHDPGDPWDGKELDLTEFEERVRISRMPFPDQHFDVQDVLADNEKVMLTWNWRGTHLGDLPGFPPSGQQITMTGATVYYIDNQKITGHWQLVDRFGVYQQLRQHS
jgi:steroid delta-isomerase-like uncharacterized protein